MAIATRPTTSNDTGISTLADLYNLATAGGGGTTTQTNNGGTSTVTDSGGTTESGTSSWQDAYSESLDETVHSSISAAGLNDMLKNLLEGNQGLAAVSAGQRGAGGYNASTNTLLINDLMARAAGQVAQNDKTVTTNSVRNVGARTGGSASVSVRAPSTQTTVREPSTTTTEAPTAKINNLGKALGALGIYSKAKGLLSSGSGAVDADSFSGTGVDSSGNANAFTVRDFENNQLSSTELATQGSYIAGGDLGPGPNTTAFDTFSGADTGLGFDNTVFDLPTDLPVDSPVDFPVDSPIDFPVDTPIDYSNLPEWDFDFADGGSVSKKINNQVGYQGNKTVDLRAGMSGKLDTTYNPEVADQILGNSMQQAATRVQAPTRQDLVQTHRAIGKPDMAEIKTTDLSALDENGNKIDNYNQTSRGTANRPSTTGLDSNGQNPNANKVVNSALGGLGMVMPPLGVAIGVSNFAQNPGVESGVNLANKVLRIPGLNVGIQAANAILKAIRGDDGTKGEEAAKLGLGTGTNAEGNARGNSIRKFEQAKVIDNDIDKGGEDTKAVGVPIPTPVQLPPDDQNNNPNAMPIDEPTTGAILDDTALAIATPQLDEFGEPIRNYVSGSSSQQNIPGGGINNSAGGSNNMGGTVENPNGSGSTYAADGGLIQGPGTSISDSIDAKLSTDEFVVSGDVVKALGLPFFENLQRKYHTPAAIQKLRGGR